MRSNDVRDDLADGFEVLEGAPREEPLRTIPPPRPRLCEQGPCENYHRFDIQTEAEDPRAVKLSIALPAGTRGATPTEGGTLYQAPSAFHVQSHHYCYPTPGVEMNLGSLPVIRCNRWKPIGVSAEWFLEKSEAGKKYQADVAAWEAARAAELKQDEEIDRLIAQSQTVPPGEGEAP